MSDQIFDCAQGVGTCLACGKNFECGASWAKGPNFGFNPLPGAQEKFMSKQEVYHSSTLGSIPLSFTGRRLMQNLREAFQEMLKRSCDAAKAGHVRPATDWEDVSKARGKLAQYMSELERKQVPPQSMLDELARLRAFEASVRPQITYHEPMVTPPLSFGRLAQVYGRAKQAPLITNEYLVRVVEKPGKPPLRKTNGIIVTEVQVAGTMTVLAYSMDEALDKGVQMAHAHGFTELTKKDFEVRLLSVPEAP